VNAGARRVGAAIVAAWLACAVQAAGAAEFRSVAQPAVLYDAPSLLARKLFVAPRGMPVEVVSSVNLWVKVRDQAGDFAWIERADLASQRTVVARAVAAVRAEPREGADLVFQADRGVVLELVEPAPAPGWARVRHRDGSAGFVRAAEVWGL
jgi:SH3-like domain-containing protein